MFAAYNKTNTKGALVGNWVEEDALRETTGFARRKVPTGLFAPDRKEARFEATHGRVLLHDAPPRGGCNSHASSTTPPPFETTAQASTRYSDFAVNKPGPGPRSSQRELEVIQTAKRLNEQQRALARQEEEREYRAAAATTVAKSSFQPLETSALLATKRVPRGRNGALSRRVDPSIQDMTKGQVDSIDQMKLDLLQGAAVTRYSHAITTGVGLDFPMSASDMTNAFGRSSTFTNEINDPSKRHGEATEPGCDHDERVGASVHQRSALNRMLQLLKRNPTSAKRLTDRLRLGASGVSLDQEDQDHPQQYQEHELPLPREYIDLGEFRAALSAADLTLSGAVRGLPAALTDKEVIHIFMYFDADSVGAIRLAPVLAYCASLGEKTPYHSQ